MAKRCCPTCGQELPKITMESLRIELPLLSRRRKSGTYLTIEDLGRSGSGIFWCNDDDGPGACIGEGAAKGTDALKAELATAAEKIVQNPKDPDALASLDFWAVELAAEELFHAKSERYFFDSKALREPATAGHAGPRFDTGKTRAAKPNHVQQGDRVDDGSRNKRSVWTIATRPYHGAHFAVMPPDLVEPCVLAGSRAGDTVLDPFGGSGTVGMVARWLGRDSILCELNPEYVAMIEERVLMPREKRALDDVPESQLDLFGGQR